MGEPSWDAVRCFVSVARLGSLTRASTELGLSVPTLGRRIDSLETALGLKLLRRGPDGAALTDAGRHILEYAEPGAHHLRQISRAARTMKDTPALTHIRISSTEPMISEVLAPRLPSLYDHHPDICLDLEASIEITNLNIGDADIAIRLAKPKGDTLIATKLPVIKMGLFCSPDYLAGRDPEQLIYADESWLAYDRAYGPIPENLWFEERALQPAIILRSGSVKTLINAAKAGLGIAMLPIFQAEREDLFCLSQTDLPNRTPWIVFHRDTRRQKEMKVVRQWIVESCKLVF